MRGSGQKANETETHESWGLFQEEVLKKPKLIRTLSWICQILDLWVCLFQKKSRLQLVDSTLGRPDNVCSEQCLKALSLWLIMACGEVKIQNRIFKKLLHVCDVRGWCNTLRGKRYPPTSACMSLQNPMIGLRRCNWQRRERECHLSLIPSLPERTGKFCSLELSATDTIRISTSELLMINWRLFHCQKLQHRSGHVLLCKKFKQY